MLSVTVNLQHLAPSVQHVNTRNQQLGGFGYRFLLPLLFSFLGLTQEVFAGEVTLGWNEVSDSRVAVYQVHFGLQSHQYAGQVETTATLVTIPELQDGEAYFFAVRACDDSRTLCSAFSDEVSTVIPIPPVTTTPVVADFYADTRSGTVPLTVLFTDTSTGELASHAWDFGDGGTSSATDAVYTYSVPGTYTVSLTVSGPDGTDTVVKLDYIDVLGTAPTADFAADVTLGPAPLSVQFQDMSDGVIDDWHWDFGDGTTSSAREPLHTYADSGTYSVTLTVSGPGGDDGETKIEFVHVTEPTPVTTDEIPLEAGEITLDHNWMWVDFQQEFLDPIVIAGPASGNDLDPAVVRVGAVYDTGFWVRLQEWDYLDDYHEPESVSYMVLERGTHQLANGASFEAGRTDLKATSSFVSIPFGQAFGEPPVVLTTVTTSNEVDTIITQVQNVNENGFEVRLREQEASTQWHRWESIDYVALEISTGTIGDFAYEVARTLDEVTDIPFNLTFQSAFDAEPLFLAHAQTSNGLDTAELRAANKTNTAVDIWVDEEQSADTETTHAPESVGYFALAPETPAAAIPVFRVNTGGNLIAAIDGRIDWEADTDSSPHPFRNSGSYSAAGTVTAYDLSVDLSTTPTDIFGTERYDPSYLPEMQWDVPLGVAIGSLIEVRLYFGNTWLGTSNIGERIFDVTIDGAIVLEDYDVIADVGHQVGVVKSYVVPFDGNVDIDFGHTTENPLVRAIEILELR